MYNITLISTRHDTNGKCNSDELLKIIEKICPEVIFLEALKSDYTDYQHLCFTSSGIYHQRLEIQAIQKYNHKQIFEYIPILDNGLSDDFEKILKLFYEHPEYQKLNNYYNSLEKQYGFQFLNSEKSIEIQEELRELGKHIFKNNELYQKADASIDDYENSMIRNIYAYCKENTFKTAIFMCGVAHRKSIIEKIQKYQMQETTKLNWNTAIV